MTAVIDRFIKNAFGNLTGYSKLDTDPASRNRIAEYAMLKSYQTVYERNKIKRPLNTLKKITYTENLAFGATQEEAKRQMSNPPIEALFNTNKINRNILLFAEKKSGVHVQVEMHFHENSLFLFKVLFPKATPILRINLIKQLLTEYGIANVDLTLHTVYDHNNNCIQIRDLNTFEVIYSALDSPFYNKLVKELNRSNNQLLADYKLTDAPIITR
ncbi:MAG: hypothetical protein ACI9GM_000479 [Salibacteraceae bacterium]|jgi:hypothetical protein